MLITLKAVLFLLVDIQHTPCPCVTRAQGYPYLHDASANQNVHVSNASRHHRCWLLLLLLLLLFRFFELYSRQRGRLRQLRAPSPLDSSGLVLLLLPPAPRQAGRDCSALCVLFSYSLLLCALLCGRSWQAELSFWVDDYFLDFFNNTAADTASECDSYGHRRCWTAPASCPYYSCRHRGKPVGIVLSCVCSRIRAKTASI